MVFLRWASLAGASVKRKISEKGGAAVSASFNIICMKDRTKYQQLIINNNNKKYSLSEKWHFWPPQLHVFNNKRSF